MSHALGEPSDESPGSLAATIVAELAGELEIWGLPLPPVPPAVAAHLVRLGPLSVVSPGAPANLYDAGDELFSAWLDDPRRVRYAISHEGRGQAGWAFHYLVCCGRVGAFVQTAWGNPAGAGPSAGDAASLEQIYGDLAELIVAAGDPDDRPRVALWLSDLDGDRWSAVPPGRATPTELEWATSDRAGVLAAARAHLAAEASPRATHADAAQAGLADYLACDDLDRLAELALELPLPSADDSRRIAAVLAHWTDVRAVANLLLHPALIPPDMRASATARALSDPAQRYPTFAALVGLGEPHGAGEHALADPGVATLVVELASTSARPLVAQRAAMVIAQHPDRFERADVEPLTASTDEVVRHNAEAALARAAGSLTASPRGTAIPALAEWRA